MSVFTNETDERRWFCRQRWWTILQRPIPDEGTMDTCYNILATQGGDGLEGYLQTASEGETLMLGVRNASLWWVNHPIAPGIDLTAYILEMVVVNLGRPFNQKELDAATAYCQVNGTGPWISLLTNSPEAAAWRARLGA